MNIKTKTLTLLFALVLFSSFAVVSNVQAEVIFKYKFLEGLPGVFKAGQTVEPDLIKLVIGIYKFGIWTVGIAALFMIVIGGFMYMTSAGNTSSIGKAKGVIKDAFVGLIAALCSNLLLFVINPDLTKVRIDLVKNTVVAPGPPMPPVNPNAPGCPASAAFANQAVVNHWAYSKEVSQRGKTIAGITYTDCSDLSIRSLHNAGCKIPALDAAGLFARGQEYSGPNDLKAGDVMVRLADPNFPGSSNHAEICILDGCSKIANASGKIKGVIYSTEAAQIVNKTGIWRNARVVKTASLNCTSC